MPKKLNKKAPKVSQVSAKRTKVEEKEEKKKEPRTWKDPKWAENNKNKQHEKKERKKKEEKPKKVIRGEVVSFNDVKGFGFIRVNYGSYHSHTIGVDYRSIIGTKTLRKGQIVSFEISSKYGKEEAKNVIIIDDVDVFYGTITWYNYERKFGFITMKSGNRKRDIFFRGSQLYNFINKKGILTDAQIGANVIFEIFDGEYEDQDVAIRIKRDFSVKKDKKKEEEKKDEINSEINKKNNNKKKTNNKKKEEKKTTKKDNTKKSNKVNEKKEEEKKDEIKEKTNAKKTRKKENKVKKSNKVAEKKEEKKEESKMVTKKKRKRKPKYAKNKSAKKSTTKKENKSKSGAQKVKEGKLSAEVFGSHKGMVKYFKVNKYGGYGFIKMFDGSEDLMFYKNDVIYKKNICIGDNITFDIKYDEIEDNYFAEKIRLLRNQTVIAVPPSSKEKREIKKRISVTRKERKELRNNINFYNDSEYSYGADNYSVVSSNNGANTVIESVDGSSQYRAFGPEY